MGDLIAHQLLCPQLSHSLFQCCKRLTRCFPSQTLCQVVVDGLLPTHEDASLLISRFQEYMEYDDVRYFVMKAVTASVGQVMQKAKQVTNCHCSGGSGSAALGCVSCAERN